MIRQGKLYLLIYSVLLSLSFNVHSDNAAVISWTQQTLLQTMSVSYEELQSTTPRTIEASYTKNGWDGMNTFFANYIQQAINEKLTLHPSLIGPGIVTQSGTVKNNFFNGVPFWRVNQTLAVPELSLNIDFAVLVIKTESNRYLIQSLDINERKIPL